MLEKIISFLSPLNHWYLFAGSTGGIRLSIESKREASEAVAEKYPEVMRLKVFADNDPLWEIQWGLPERVTYKKLSF